ncbi:39S ribosomal protein L36, mitochondrial [Trachymyrmex septentrionalis]|uniref:Large ribosomal subunit protein bL36m n=1 Tax=Trachymyrmex septentrionalis TaxID=34720 RepID=A0A195FVE4_9HYME|nr:39S ribosomal protein L36, mitochondrial [Trachymyrmex septentrionalis]
MNVAVIFKSVYQTINSMAPKVLTIPTVENVLFHRIHYMCNREKLYSSSNLLNHKSTYFLLQPILPIYNSICGLKAKGQLQLRCKDCYFLCKNNTWYVMCKTHPRHKQVKIKKKEYKTWILTSASQSKVRGW